MLVAEELKTYSKQPITHQLLVSLLKGYKRPNDKIHELLNAGLLQPLKKGMYITGPALGGGRPEPMLIANHLLGPSYVSVDTALSYYGLIPERVYQTTSMTVKSSRTFDTPAGTFVYWKLALPYYAYGINQVEIAANQHVLIASPEKALCDKIVTTGGVILRSKKDVMYYLTQDLRIDEESLAAFQTSMMETWLAESPKEESLSMLIKTLQTL